MRWKKLFPAIKHSNLQGKNVFRNNYFESQPFPMSYYFTRIFVHLSVIAAACYFNVYKLIGWDPVKIYLFKAISRNTRTKRGKCPNLTINTVESCSGVFSLNTFHTFFSVSIVDLEQVIVCQGALSCVNIIIQSLKMGRCISDVSQNSIRSFLNS